MQGWKNLQKQSKRLIYLGAKASLTQKSMVRDPLHLLAWMLGWASGQALCLCIISPYVTISILLTDAISIFPKSRSFFNTMDTIFHTQVVQNWNEWGHNPLYFVEILLVHQFTSLIQSWLSVQIATEEGKDESIRNQFLKYPA